MPLCWSILCTPALRQRRHMCSHLELQRAVGRFCYQFSACLFCPSNHELTDCCAKCACVTATLPLPCGCGVPRVCSVLVGAMCDSRPGIVGFVTRCRVDAEGVICSMGFSAWNPLCWLQISQGHSVNERDKNGSTPLMHATWHATSTNDGMEIMRLLVEAGADVNVRARLTARCATHTPSGGAMRLSHRECRAANSRYVCCTGVTG
jgi:hypothetical protein